LLERKDDLSPLKRNKVGVSHGIESGGNEEREDGRIDEGAFCSKH